MNAHTRHPTDSDRTLVRWRERTLLAAGFDATLAARVAGEPGFDLHAVLELVDRGCPPQLAARIVAPLEWETR